MCCFGYGQPPREHQSVQARLSIMQCRWAPALSCTSTSGAAGQRTHGGAGSQVLGAANRNPAERNRAGGTVLVINTRRESVDESGPFNHQVCGAGLAQPG
jgi:hypothetical protein